MFLWQHLPDGLQGDFQLISRLRLQLEFMVLFQHGVPDTIVLDSNLETLGLLVLLSKPGSEDSPLPASST